MNCRGLFIFAAFIGAINLCSAQPATSTAPSNPLLGRWHFLSLGKKKCPENVQLFWTFDEHNVIVSAATGDLATKSQYTLRSVGDHNVITFTPDGKTDADRAGWYEIKDGKLVMQVEVGTDKAPAEWATDKVMVFESVVIK